MSSLNLLSVWATLAAIGVAVPIIIHLLYRKNRKETDWAAMELLRRALVQRSGQIKLEDFIILLLRCLTLLLLAAALLRPVLTNKEFIGDSKVGMIVAIDDSMSMNHGATTRFENAIEAARKVTGTASPGDKISIIFLNEKDISDIGKVPLRSADYDANEVSKILDQAKKNGASNHQSNLENSIPILKEMADEIKAGTKEIHIITDAQQSDWNNLSSEAKGILGDISASIYVIPVNSENDDNRSVTSLQYVSGSLNNSGVARFEATIKNHGNNDANSGDIEFYQDGNLVSRQPLGVIESNSSKVISFLANYNKPGDLSVSAKISKDNLSEDNLRHTVVNIRPNIRVLCATDSASDGLENSTNGLFFLENALRLRSTDEGAGIQVTSVDSSDLTLEKFNEYDIIILANVSSPSVEIAEKLKTFTTNGGGLMIFAGDNIDQEKYGQAFGITPESILPAVIGNKTTASEEDNNQWTLAVPSSDHPIARVLKLIPEDMINGAKLNSVIELKPLSGSQTILKLVENNAPLLVSKNTGEGSVTICSTSADRSWSDLAIHPIYTIMIQQAVTTTTSKPGSRLAMVHSPKSISIEGIIPSNAKLQKNNIGGNDAEDIETSKLAVSAITNDSFKVEVKPEDITDTGIYNILDPQDSSLGIIAVNSDSAESNVKVAAGDALKETIGTINNVSIIVESPDEAILNKRTGSDLTSILLMLSIICFVLQSILAKYFTNKISKGETDIAASLQLSNVAAARRT